jgi:hypothetical protein
MKTMRPALAPGSFIRETARVLNSIAPLSVPAEP